MLTARPRPSAASWLPLLALLGGTTVGTAVGASVAHAAAPKGGWTFTEVAAAAGVAFDHAAGGPMGVEPLVMAGGVAGGDYDDDGWVDLYAVGGASGVNRLFRNRADGTFEEVATAAGVAVSGDNGSGPAWADLDGDGCLDLLLGGVFGTRPRVFRNDCAGKFTESTVESGITTPRDTFSAAFADYDGDGDLDAFLTHWSGIPQTVGHLWKNDGSGHFTDADLEAGIADAFLVDDFSFTPNFADIDGDGDLDLLLAGDFGTSKVFENFGDGTFGEVTGPVITDENGMGAAVEDYDNDGDYDWFVSSIWDPNGTPEGNWGVTGNRLYRNLGDGTFEDATDEAGVRQGYWGWGSCLADLDNDGWLDLFHVNGFPAQAALEFLDDPARLWIAEGDGTFTERSVELGVVATGQGRGVVCFDYDRDGDIDLFLTNNTGPSRLFRNDGGNALGHWLGVRLRDDPPNVYAIGAEVIVTTGGTTRRRRIAAGNNYVSQNPAEAHFGLGAATVADEVRVRWPDGGERVLAAVAADQWLVIERGEPVVEIPALQPSGVALLALLLAAAALAWLRHSP